MLTHLSLTNFRSVQLKNEEFVADSKTHSFLFFQKKHLPLDEIGCAVSYKFLLQFKQ